MTMEERNEKKTGISGRLREGFEGSWRSLSKIEAEGEKLVKGMVGALEKHGVDAGTKAVEDLGRDARAFFNQLNESIEESAEKVLKGLNVPTKDDLDLYNRKVKTLIDENVKSRLEKLKVPTGKDLDVMAKQLRGNLEEQVRKGLGRLNLATRKEVEAVSKDLKKLQKDVTKLTKAGASKATKPVAKKPAAKKAKAAPAKKTTKKKA
jgi:polyhydroxyalkanoate synthesis regulator phasin